MKGLIQNKLEKVAAQVSALAERDNSDRLTYLFTLL